MKKATVFNRVLALLLVCVLCIGVLPTTARAESDAVLHELDTTVTANKGANNAYASNCDVEVDGITWNVTGNSSLNPWRIGGKSLSGVNREVYTKTAIPGTTKSVSISIGAASNITINSVKLLVADNGDFTDAAQYDFVGVAENQTATVALTTPVKDAFLKFVFNVTVTDTKTNRFIAFNGCTISGTPADDAVAVENVALNKPTLKLETGTSETLIATVSPENATNKNVTWTSSNESVATVNDGLVTAVAPGTATITAKTKDGGFEASCEVTVSMPDVSDFVETDVSKIGENDIVIITTVNGENIYYAMSNDKGTSAAPSAIKQVVMDGKILGDVPENIMWKVQKNNKGEYSFVVLGGTNALYTTDTNNGVRVGTNDNKYFTVADNYLKNVATNRYLGVYNSSDWRCYTGNGGNIANQTLTFFVKELKFTTAEVSLGGDIVTQFTANQDIPADATVTATLGGKEVACTQDGATVSVKVPAKDMDKDVVVTVSREGKADVTATQSVNQYCESLGNLPAAQQTFVDAMLAFGAAAKNYFSESETVSAPTAWNADSEKLLKDFDKQLTPNGSAFTYVGYSLLLRDKITLRFYFETALDLTDCAVTWPGAKEAVRIDETNRYYVDADAVPPLSFGEKVTFSVANGSDSLEIQAGVLSYAKEAIKLAEEDSNKTNLANTMKWLVLYWNAANALIQD